MKTEIEQQICTSFEYYDALKPENQKLFPFYLHTNFNSSRNYPIVYEHNLFCSYCNQEIESGHGGYYTAFIVFESATDIMMCCNVYHCRPKPIPYTYHEQSYGYPKPIVLPDKFSESLRHLIVASCFLSPDKMYAINKYLASGVTWDEFNELTARSTYCGGSHICPPNGDTIYCSWQWNGKYLETREGEIVKLGKADIVNIVNEILAENRPVRQLSMF